MQFSIVSIVAFLAATSVAVPVTNTPRQLGALGGLTSPVTGALSQAGKTVPPAVERAGDSLHPEGKKNATEPATAAKAAKPQSKSGLSGLTGILGGIVPAGLVPGSEEPSSTSPTTHMSIAQRLWCNRELVALTE
ncbi:hypothetical protein F5X97DRAFT_318836 [Nemania serpens]|nr:hypothetical protein F5X97DRAFT_318836 [Nemania serpens]